MPGPIAVSKFDVRSMDAPDERRTPPKTTVDVMHMDGATIGRFTFQPGWRWSECVKPVVGTESCQSSHAGYALSGKIVVRLADGVEKTIEGGSAYSIPPGHDGWVVGDEPFVGLEVISADTYAKPG